MNKKRIQLFNFRVKSVINFKEIFFFESVLFNLSFSVVDLHTRHDQWILGVKKIPPKTVQNALFSLNLLTPLLELCVCFSYSISLPKNKSFHNPFSDRFMRTRTCCSTPWWPSWSSLWTQSWRPRPRGWPRQPSGVRSGERGSEMSSPCGWSPQALSQARKFCT